MNFFGRQNQWGFMGNTASTAISYRAFLTDSTSFEISSIEGTWSELLLIAWMLVD